MTSRRAPPQSLPPRSPQLRRRRLACGLALAPLAARAGAQVAAEVPPAAVASSAAPTLSVELVKTGLYLIRGGGAHSLLRLSAAGAILVGGKDVGAYGPLRSQVARINRLSDLPVRVVILPDHLDAHAANHALFTTSGVAVMAQSNALRHLAAAAAAAPPVPAPAAAPPRPPGPRIGFEQQHQFRMGGVEVRLFHFGAAHSDSDAVVLFPDLKVLAVGHLVTDSVPWPDFDAGGRLAGWARALNEVLRLDFDVAVASAGPLLGRADVEAARRRLETLTARATELIRAGTSKQQFVGALRTDDLGAPLPLPTSALDPLYAELGKAG